MVFCVCRRAHCILLIYEWLSCTSSFVLMLRWKCHEEISLLWKCARRHVMFHPCTEGILTGYGHASSCELSQGLEKTIGMFLIALIPAASLRSVLVSCNLPESIHSNFCCNYVFLCASRLKIYRQLMPDYCWTEFPEPPMIYNCRAVLLWCNVQNCL